MWIVRLKLTFLLTFRSLSTPPFLTPLFNFQPFFLRSEVLTERNVSTFGRERERERETGRERERERERERARERERERERERGEREK